MDITLIVTANAMRVDTTVREALQFLSRSNEKYTNGINVLGRSGALLVTNRNKRKNGRGNSTQMASYRFGFLFKRAAESKLPNPIRMKRKPFKSLVNLPKLFTSNTAL